MCRACTVTSPVSRASNYPIAGETLFPREQCARIFSRGADEMAEKCAMGCYQFFNFTQLREVFHPPDKLRKWVRANIRRIYGAPTHFFFCSTLHSSHPHITIISSSTHTPHAPTQGCMPCAQQPRVLTSPWICRSCELARRRGRSENSPGRSFARSLFRGRAARGAQRPDSRER